MTGAWVFAHPGFNGDLPAGSTPLAPPEGWSSAARGNAFSGDVVVTWAEAGRQPKVIAAIAGLARDPRWRPPYLGPVSGGTLQGLLQPAGSFMSSFPLFGAVPDGAFAVLSEEKAK